MVNGLCECLKNHELAMSICQEWPKNSATTALKEAYVMGFFEGHHVVSGHKL